MMFSLARSFARITSTCPSDCSLRTIVVSCLWNISLVDEQSKEKVRVMFSNHCLLYQTNPKKRGWLTRSAKRVIVQKKKNEFAKRRAVAEKYKDVVRNLTTKSFV